MASTERLDVRTVFDAQVNTRPDVDVLRYAHAEGRIVLTHDPDFGRLAILGGERFSGIIYLRPGHRDVSFTIGTLRTLQMSPIDVHPPFIIVAERRAAETRVRVRQMDAPGSPGEQ